MEKNIMSHFPEHKLHTFYKGIDRSKIKYNLSDASAEIPKLSDLMDLERLVHMLDAVPLTYSEGRGSEQLRTLIAALYQNVSSDEVSVFTGAQEAILCAQMNLLDKGDEVITFSPFYPSLSNFFDEKEIKIKFYHLKQSNQWQIDLSVLEDMVSRKTKMIIINFPHNPTGSTLNKQQLVRIAAIARKHNLYILSDEVSIFSIYDNDFPPLSMTNFYDKTISVSVLSKSFGLPGIRIGWSIVKDEATRSCVNQARSYMSICHSQLDEAVTIEVLKKSKDLLFKNNKIIKNNLILLRELCSQHSDKFYWTAPCSGLLTLLHYKKGSGQDLSKKLLNQFSGMLLPGDLFGAETNSVRIGLGKKAFPEQIKDLFNVV